MADLRDIEKLRQQYMDEQKRKEELKNRPVVKPPVYKTYPTRPVVSVSRPAEIQLSNSQLWDLIEHGDDIANILGDMGLSKYVKSMDLILDILEALVKQNVATRVNKIDTTLELDEEAEDANRIDFE